MHAGRRPELPWLRSDRGAQGHMQCCTSPPISGAPQPMKCLKSSSRVMYSWGCALGCLAFILCDTQGKHT